MVNSIQRDLKRRKLVSKFELKRLEYKNYLKDFSLSKEFRYQQLLKLNKLPRNSSKTRVKNRCIITGRGRAVYRFCQLSRIKLRELAGQGHLAGIVKSSW